MKPIAGMIVPAAAAALLGLAQAVCLAGQYGPLADSLVQKAGEADLSRLAIAEFASPEQAGQEDARAAQQELSEALFSLGKIRIMDIAVLRSLNERGAGWPQGMIDGRIYGGGNGRILVVKLTDLRSGRLVAALQVPMPVKPGAAAPGDMRDALGEPMPKCERLAGDLREANRATVEIKARYWAAKVREPGFSYADPGANPFSWFMDYATVQRLYLLSDAYYKQAGPVELSAEERGRIAALEDREAAAAKECRQETQMKK